MEKGHHIESRVWAIAEPVLAFEGYELVEVEYTREHGRWILRLYMDSPSGVTLEDTTKVSRLLDPILDVEDPIEHAYYLEVSSPGLDRPIRKKEHFLRFVGEEVKVRARDPLDVGEKVARRNFNGVLVGAEGAAITVEIDDRVYEVPLDEIQRARLVYRHGVDGGGVVTGDSGRGSPKPSASSTQTELDARSDEETGLSLEGDGQSEGSRGKGSDARREEAAPRDPKENRR